MKGVPKLVVYCAVLGLGLLQALATRFAMQSDGISYLDMGDAIVRGDWNMAINGYWSPLYPLLLGLVLRILNPSSYWQFTVVHLVNFAVYAFAFVCFDFFLERLLPDRSGDENGRIPRWLLFSLGYLAFTRLALTMVTLERVSPDLLMAGFVFLACGQLLRLSSTRSFVLLGATLGVGYLAKAPLFPLSFVIMGLALIAGGDWRRKVPGVTIALLVFLSISGTYIGIISVNKGRLLVSDSGRLNYVVLVNHASPGWYFQNLGTAGGRYLHPVRKIGELPTIYEFGTPIKGTQPIWYDPSYWSQGATPRLDMRAWMWSIRSQMHEYFDLLWHGQKILLIGFLLLGCVAAGRDLWRGLWEQWPLLLLAFAGLVMYSLSLVQGRYVAVFFMLICALWLRAIGEAVSPASSRIRTAVALTLLVVAGASLAWSTAAYLTRSPAVNTQWQVAEDLKNFGVLPAAKVARIGGLYSADWARLAGLTVVAEVPREGAEGFWASSIQDKERVIGVFRDLGVKAIVAVPPVNVSQVGPEWRKLSNGSFYMLVF